MYFGLTVVQLHKLVSELLNEMCLFSMEIFILDIGCYLRLS